MHITELPLSNCIYLKGSLIFVICVNLFKVSSRVEKDYSDLFDGDDTNNAGDFLNDNAVETPSFSKRIINDEEEDDDLMLASGRTRQRSHILEDDENSVGMY